MKIIAIYIFLLLFSCTKNLKSENKLDKFYQLAQKEWIYTFELNSFVQSGENIEKPPGVMQLIMNLKVPNNFNSKLGTYCFYYLTPFKNILGKLTVTYLKENKDCEKDNFEVSQVEFEIDKINKLKITSLNEDLHFAINFKDQDVKFKLHLQNLNQKILLEKYSPPFRNKKYKGLTFLKNIELINGENNFIGKLSDRFKNNTAIRCLQVDKNCEQVGENRCHECRYGVYSVVDYNCKNGSSKFCGQSHCGEKNEPACVRGFEYSENLSEEELGICESDLTPVYNSDHILVCQ